jgi:hypothetical protein
MHYHLDADMNGTDSIQFLIDAGLVRHIPCPGYAEFSRACQWILQNANPDEDTVAVDTLGQLAFATRSDAKLGTDPTVDLWDRRGLFLDGDKNYLTVYDMAGQFIMRNLRNLRSRGFRIITTSHETEQVDKSEGYAQKKIAPAMNKALYEALRAVTSDVFRLWILRQAIYNPQTQEVLYAPGTRVWQINSTEQAVAKYHTDPFTAMSLPIHTPIKNAITPALPVLYDVLKKKPTWINIYGEPGVGKTSAACSEAFALYLLQHPELVRN